MGEPFEPPGVVLFRLQFRVHDYTSAAEFNRFIVEVERELRERIQGPRFFGSTTMLPQSRGPRRWFVIDLSHENHSIPLLIEAETIYLRGYQNEHGDVFEFKQDDGKSYLTSKERSASSSSKGRKPTQLSFSCNYNSIVKSTRLRGPGGSVLNPGVTLEAAGYCRDQLQSAVDELAKGRNLPGESQHETAQNLLRVIVMFCEPIRFRSVREAMMKLWTTTSGGGSLSPHCLGQINNWSCIGRNLVNSHRDANFAWSPYLTGKTGVGNADAAQGVLAFVLFQDVDEKKGEVPYPYPDKGNLTRWLGDDSRGRGGGGGGGSASGGGAWGGVLADEVPVPPGLYNYTMPEEPVMEILSVSTPRHTYQGIYGRITVTDGFGAQTIYQRSRDNYQSPSDDSGDVMMLELDVQKRAIPAYDCVDIDVDLYDASTQARLAAGHMSWNSCDFEVNRYDVTRRWDIGDGDALEYIDLEGNRYDVTTPWDIGEGVALEYIVYSRAVQVAVSVTVDNGGDAGRGWFTTRNTMIGTAPRRRPMYAGIGDHLLRGDHVAAVPIGFKLEVAVGLEHEGSLEPVLQTFEEEPSEEGGTSPKTGTLQGGATAKVNLAWNLLRKEPPALGPTSGTQDPTNGRDEL